MKPARLNSSQKQSATIKHARINLAPSWLCAVVLLASVLPATDGNVCEEQQLSQPHFASIMSLPIVHPAQVILRNLVSGNCSLMDYTAQRKATMFTIRNTEATIELLGGLVSESSGLVSGNSTSTDATQSICTDLESQATCAQRYVSDLFSALADDSQASTPTWDGALQLPSVLNRRSNLIICMCPCMLGWSS